MLLVLQLLINGLLLAGIYLLLAIGFNLVMGVMKIVNFSHGDVVVLGGLVASSAYAVANLHPAVACLVIVPVAFVLGCVVERWVIEPVVGGAPMAALLMTFGLSMLLVNLGVLIWGGEPRAIPVLTGSYSIGEISLAKVRLVTFGLAALVTCGLFAFVRFNSWGRAMRATALHPEIAMTCGVNVRKVRLITFGASYALASFAGILMVMMIPVDPQAGSSLVVKSFSVVVLGGLGNFTGIIVASIVLAVSEVYAAYYVSPVLSEALAFLILVLVLLARKTGSASGLN